jgi:hypothetical protein
MKLIQDMLEAYDRKAKPTWDNNKASEDGKEGNRREFQAFSASQRHLLDGFVPNSGAG